MAETQTGSRIIEASPTKEFFISMLAKDIGLIRAILDLVDNSIDGATRLIGTQELDGLWIRLEINSNYFRITDNCGGIPVEIARHYAFRFGRPSDMEGTPHSIGQFGVGMKRSLFKLGSKFEIDSRTSSSRFKLDVDVNVWKTTPEWQFEFKELEEDIDISADNIGTSISVNSLHTSVADEFRLENFVSRLRDELKSAYSTFIQQGLAITLNQTPVDFQLTELLSSDELQPAYHEMNIQGDSEEPLTVKIFVGIAKSAPQQSGWYIYCNGRLVLGPDRTNVTGWGEQGAIPIPQFHNQYARFRGYVFFDSDDASRLPWNTTKTGVDADSPEYRAVRQQMIVMSRPVIDFLNELDQEKDTGDTARLEAVERAKPLQSLFDLEPTRVFKAEISVPVAPIRNDVTISYKRPVEDVELAKEQLQATTNREVGEKTFEYYIAMECDE